MIEIVGFAQMMPYVRMKMNKTNNKPYLESGLDSKIIKTIQNRMNFTVDLVNCNRVWGIQLPNKSWTGIIGALHQKVSFRYAL